MIEQFSHKSLQLIFLFYNSYVERHEQSPRHDVSELGLWRVSEKSNWVRVTETHGYPPEVEDTRAALSNIQFYGN